MAAEEKGDFRDFIEIVQDAAIEAELETGRREETIEAAKAHILIRLATIFGGFFLIILGIVLMPLPGPGWAIVAGGLALLATEFTWANRLLTEVRRRIPGVPADGKIPTATLMVYFLMFVVFTTASIVYGAAIKEWFFALF